MYKKLFYHYYILSIWILNENEPKDANAVSFFFKNGINVIAEYIASPKGLKDK